MQRCWMTHYSRMTANNAASSTFISCNTTCYVQCAIWHSYQGAHGILRIRSVDTLKMLFILIDLTPHPRPDSLV